MLWKFRETQGTMSRANRYGRESATLDNQFFIRLVPYMFVVYLICSCLRIFMTTSTVSLLGHASELESEVTSLANEYRDLRVEKSQLMEMDRIENIATENYGMVLAEDVETMDIDIPVDPDNMP